MTPRGLAVIACLFATPAACSSSTAPQDSPPRCPPGTAPDPPRTATLLAQLRTFPETATLLSRAPDPPLTVCYSPDAPNALAPARTALLQSTLPTPESAARLAHLLLHAVDGDPFSDTAPGDCPSRISHAITVESHAFALEFRLRKHLSVERPHLAPDLDHLYWQSPEPDRLPTIERYLRAHPHGAPGLDAIVAGYERRCRPVAPPAPER